MKKNIIKKDDNVSKVNSSKRKAIIFILVSILLISIDQLSKLWVVNNSKLMAGERISIIENFFDLRYAFNRGAAFSFLANSDWGIYLLSAISILASLLFLVLIIKYSNHKFLFPFSLTLLLAGTAGNMIDRVRLKGVVDFFDFYFKNTHFPTFNVADICISIGAILFVLYLLFVHEEEIEFEDDVNSSEVRPRK